MLLIPVFSSRRYDEPLLLYVISAGFRWTLPKLILTVGKIESD